MSPIPENRQRFNLKKNTETLQMNKFLNICKYLNLNFTFKNNRQKENLEFSWFKIL